MSLVPPTFASLPLTVPAVRLRAPPRIRVVVTRVAQVALLNQAEHSPHGEVHRAKNIRPVYERVHLFLLHANDHEIRAHAEQTRPNHERRDGPVRDRSPELEGSEVRVQVLERVLPGRIEHPRVFLQGSVLLLDSPVLQLAAATFGISFSPAQIAVAEGDVGVVQSSVDQLVGEIGQRVHFPAELPPCSFSAIDFIAHTFRVIFITVGCRRRCGSSATCVAFFLFTMRARRITFTHSLMRRV